LAALTIGYGRSKLTRMHLDGGAPTRRRDLPLRFGSMLQQRTTIAVVEREARDAPYQ